MSQLLIPVYRGEVEYVGAFYSKGREKFLVWAQDKFRLQRIDEDDIYNPLLPTYCVPEYQQYTVNEALKSGKVIVGMDSGCWIVTARENTIP